MKTNRFALLVTAAFALAAFSTAGCAEKETGAGAPLPAAKEAVPATVTAVVPGPTPAVQAAVPASPAAVPAEWADIKDCTYDLRAQFFAGLKRLEARADDEIAELTAKRAAMTGTTDTKDWDFAMKEMNNTRFYLKAMGEELHQATAETWTQQKDKVGQAWVRTQEAYSKVKASTTS